MTKRGAVKNKIHNKTQLTSKKLLLNDKIKAEQFWAHHFLFTLKNDQPLDGSNATIKAGRFFRLFA
ncbi:hypothetical protein N9Z39_00745 [Alphaproteobacteria bacterium]|nr:hypothetical protein [Alphaproteobacteria bacterium]